MPTAELEPVKKHPGGRPSKCTADLIGKARKYLTDHESYGDVIPSIAGLSQVLNCTREVLHKWAKDKNKSEFIHIIKHLGAIQEAKLLNGGLTSKYNTTIAKLILSKHGYHDNPVNNQGPAGITVQVNRGSVVLKSGDQTLEIAEQTPGTTLEHKPD